MIANVVLVFQRLHRALNSVFTDDKLPTVTKPEKRYCPESLKAGLNSISLQSNKSSRQVHGCNIFMLNVMFFYEIDLREIPSLMD